MGKRFSLLGERGKGTAEVDGLLDRLNQRALDLEGGFHNNRENDLMGTVIGESGTVDAIRGNLLLTSSGAIYILKDNEVKKVAGKSGMTDFMNI